MRGAPSSGYGGDPSLSQEDLVQTTFTAAEVRHRLANLFQLLSTLTRMRMQRSSDPHTRHALGSVLEAVNVLGVLQQHMSGAEGGDFAAFLKDMVPQWRRGIGARPIQLDIDVNSLVVREQLASALAIIANELVVNAIAHAYPGERSGAVRVELVSLGGGRAALSVSDDGEGYDETVQDRTKLGLWLVRGLADQVRGRLTTTTNGGVTVRLEFLVG